MCRSPSATTDSSGARRGCSPGLCPHFAAAEASALTAGEHFTELAGQITKALEQLQHLLDHLQHLIGIDPLAAIGLVPGKCLFEALGLVILVVQTVQPGIGVECNATDLHLESPSLIPDELIE